METKQEEFDRLDGRFEKLKESARNGLPIPQELSADKIDCYYYEILINLFENYKLRNESKNSVIERGKAYRNGYISDKRIYERTTEINETMLKRRIECAELVEKLSKRPLRMRFKTVFNSVFELIGLLLDNDIAAKKIKETAGFCILTGCKDLTDEEIEQLKKSIKE